MKQSSTADDIYQEILQLIGKFYYSMSSGEKSDTQLIFIDTAKKIDFPFAYNKNFLIGLILILVVVGMLIAMFISCCCICANCFGMRSGKKMVIVNNADTPPKMPQTAASRYFNGLEA